MISSIDKTLHYLAAVSKDEHTFKYAGNEYHMTRKDKFTLRPSMFHKDECMSCGQCCRNYDIVFFPTDRAELERRATDGQEQYQFYLDNCEEIPIDIDGNEFTFLRLAPMTAKDSHDIWVKGHTVLNCRWIFIKDGKKLCKIHEFRCITCGFPHMELYMNRMETGGFLGHKQFGRNLQLGCPVDIRRPLDQATLDDNIYWLERLKEAADYLNVRTYLPEILDYLSKVDVDNPPTEPAVFTRTTSTKLFDI